MYILNWCEINDACSYKVLDSSSKHYGSEPFVKYIILNKLYAQIPYVMWICTVRVKHEVSPGFSPWSWQRQVVALGMMSDGEDSHAQALILYLMELCLILRDTNLCQSFQEVILSLQTHKHRTELYYLYLYTSMNNIQTFKNHPENKYPGVYLSSNILVVTKYCYENTTHCRWFE